MNLPPPLPPDYQHFDSAVPAAKPYPRGTLILVLGILSFFVCGIILGVVAFIMGSNALKEIDKNPAAYTNRSTVNAGRVCGGIGAALNVVFLLLLLVSG